jgi:hypothetical protein
MTLFSPDRFARLLNSKITFIIFSNRDVGEPHVSVVCWGEDSEPHIEQARSSQKLPRLFAFTAPFSYGSNNIKGNRSNATEAFSATS